MHFVSLLLQYWATLRLPGLEQAVSIDDWYRRQA